MRFYLQQYISLISFSISPASIYKIVLRILVLVLAISGVAKLIDSSDSYFTGNCIFK